MLLLNDTILAEGEDVVVEAGRMIEVAAHHPQRHGVEHVGVKSLLPFAAVDMVPVIILSTTRLLQVVRSLVHSGRPRKTNLPSLYLS